MGKVAEAQRGAATVLEPPVDGLGRPLLVPGWSKQASTSRGSSFQCPTEGDELLGHPVGEVIDHGLQSLLPRGPVRVAVGGDDAPVYAPSCVDLDVLITDDDGLQAGAFW